LEGRNSNTEHLKGRKENKRAPKRRKEDQDGSEDPEYGAGSIKFESVSLLTIILSDVEI
jgi:hypothetical protein